MLCAKRRPNTWHTLRWVGALFLLCATLSGCSKAADEPVAEWSSATKIAGKTEGLSHISGLVVDEQFAYVTIGGTLADQNAGTSGLRRIALASGQVTTLDPGVNLPQSDYGGIALDAEFVYWNAGGKLLRTAKAGGTPEIVAAENVGIGVDLVVDEEKVYWANHSYYSPNTPTVPSPIYAVAKTGGNAGGKVEIFADQQKLPHSLVVDDQFVYWLTPTSIVKQAKSGGAPQILYQATADEGVDELTQDATTLYFGFRAAGASRWALRKIAKGGGVPETLVKSYSLKPVVVDETHLYFFDEESSFNNVLCKVTKTGGTVTVLDRGYSSGVIAQSPTQLYFATLDDLYRFPK